MLHDGDLNLMWSVLVEQLFLYAAAKQSRELAPSLTVFHRTRLAVDPTAGLFTVEVSRRQRLTGVQHREILSVESQSISTGVRWMSSNGTTDLLCTDTDKLLIC